MQKPINYSNLFLDMNAFFASVEQQVQPPLRGQPICIAPYTGDTGCCIARSYEAKAFGVNISSVGEAKKLCPQIKIIESQPELYIFYHRQILKVLQSFSPFVEVKSVDEFNIKLSGSDRQLPNALKMAKGLKKAIAEQVGDYLKCSIGIASSEWLAKVAGELKKPDGLVTLALAELPALWRTMKLTDLPGINVGMERQLRRKKIKTPFDFFNQPLTNLSRWYSHPGRVWFFKLRGYEIDELPTATKSIGHSHVLAPEFRNPAAARRVLVKMTQKCAARLRSKKLFTGGVAIFISFLPARHASQGDAGGGGGIFRKQLIIDLCSDSINIQRAALSLYDGSRINRRPLKIAVTLFGLKQIQNEQISLFSDIEKSKRVSKTLDQINDKFGESTIYPASMFDTEEAAPNRIPFGDPGRLNF